MTIDILGGEPLVSRVGQPLRIAVYARVASAIKNGNALPGSLLPSEVELGEALGVSRTVVREALMLLEEDQLITTRRGIGRFVATVPARFGLERIAPFDELLRSAEPDSHFAFDHVEAYVQRGTEFTARGLDLDDEASTWFWEAVIRRDGKAVAIVQEHVVEDGVGSSKLSAQRRQASELASSEDARKSSSLLSLIREHIGTDLGPGEVELTVGVLGPSRAKTLNLSASQAVQIVTQKIYRRGEAIYLGKYLIAPDLGRLSVHQTALN